tara:strand:- start:2062 stop:2349 length:288 start_codon:yes stop_codon:yes gene_type:complete
MSVASHFIELTDGEYHVLPSEAKNLIMVCTSGSTAAAITLESSNIASGSGLTSVAITTHATDTKVTRISDSLLLHVKIAKSSGILPASAKLYYGV